MGAFDAERVEEARGVVGEVGRREGAPRVLALTDAAQVRDQRAQRLREGRHLQRQPAATRTRDALEQQERRARVIAVDLVVGLASADARERHAAILPAAARQRLICFRSWSTPRATALSVSKTPVPTPAQASKSGTPRGLSSRRSSATGAAFGRSRLLYWTT